MKRSLARNNHSVRKPIPKPKGKTEVRKESKVLSEAVKAEDTLKKIKEDEIKERERIMGETEQKITGGELAWLQYLRPSDVRNPEECAKMDEFNYSAYQHNNAMLPRINELLKALGRPPQRCDAPQKYLQQAKAKYEEMLFNKEFRVLKGIEYLAKRDVHAVKDYKDLNDAPTLADNIAEKEEIERLISTMGDDLIDISAVVGSTHKNNCSCENRWDGVSERCVGEGVRIRWRRLKDHHFLRPRIIPEKY